MAKVARPESSTVTTNGRPNRIERPMAAPSNSPRSVAMAAISLPAHIAITTGRGNSSRQCSARLLPVTMPSLSREREEQHRDQIGEGDDPKQQIAELRPGLDVGGEIAGVDIGDGDDDRRPGERQEPAQPPALAAQCLPPGPHRPLRQSLPRTDRIPAHHILPPASSGSVALGVVAGLRGASRAECASTGLPWQRLGLNGVAILGLRRRRTNAPGQVITNGHWSQSEWVATS